MNHVDTTKTITHVSLCAGYGGIDLGLKRAIPNMRTIAFSEIEAFACANLVAKMEAGLLDAAPVWTNLKTFPWGEFRDRVDILSGGYPCQPFSAAGKRLGKEDPRHLWPWIADGIVSMRPRVVFFENVEGHISLGLREVIEDLERLGYNSTWGIFSASEVGAPHQRKRVFILAYRNSEGLQGGIPARIYDQIRRQEQGNGFIGSSSDNRAVLANTNSSGSREDRESSQQWSNCPQQSSLNPWGMHTGKIRKREAWPSRPGEPQHEWEPPRVVGDTIMYGHPTSKITGSTSQSENEGRLQESQGGSLSLVNTESRRNGQQQTEQQGWDTSGGSGSESGAMGNSSMLYGSGQTGGQWPAQAGRTSATQHQWQAQPTLGGDTYGFTDWMDYAELYVTSDNRTDELRLLGNGVVPATAERAFRVLLEQLTESLT